MNAETREPSTIFAIDAQTGELVERKVDDATLADILAAQADLDRVTENHFSGLPLLDKKGEFFGGFRPTLPVTEG